LDAASKADVLVGNKPTTDTELAKVKRTGIQFPGELSARIRFVLGKVVYSKWRKEEAAKERPLGEGSDLTLVEEAIGHFQHAVEADKYFAEAWAGYGTCQHIVWKRKLGELRAEIRHAKKASDTLNAYNAGAERISHDNRHEEILSNMKLANEYSKKAVELRGMGVFS